MILFAVAITVFLISILGIIFTNVYCEKHNQRFGSTWVGPVFIVLLLVSTIFGLIMIPLVRTYKIDYREITNYQILKSEDAVVIDLTNSNAKISDLSNKLIKYNSYRAVTEFQDSTKIFERIERAFYGNAVLRTYTWSNPPYKFFNQE